MTHGYWSNPTISFLLSQRHSFPTFSSMNVVVQAYGKTFTDMNYEYRYEASFGNWTLDKLLSTRNICPWYQRDDFFPKRSGEAWEFKWVSDGNIIAYTGDLYCLYLMLLDLKPTFYYLDDLLVLTDAQDLLTLSKEKRRSNNSKRSMDYLHNLTYSNLLVFSCSRIYMVSAKSTFPNSLLLCNCLFSLHSIHLPYFCLNHESWLFSSKTFI